MNQKQQKPATPWPLIVLLIIISAGVILAGVFYSRIQRRNLLLNSKQELATIADLK